MNRYTAYSSEAKLVLGQQGSPVYTQTRYKEHAIAAQWAMIARKTSLLNLRVDPIIKETLRLAAEREHRSVANMVEMLVRRHCESVGVVIPDQGHLFKDGDDE